MTQATDPPGMARPASIMAMFGTQTRWTTSDYGYDSSVTIVTIGSSRFLYDQVSRLRSATLDTGPLGGDTEKTQTYTIDSFGNLQDLADFTINYDSENDELTVKCDDGVCPD